MKQIKKSSFNTINMNLLEGQINLILQSLELYAFNVRYVSKSEDEKAVNLLTSTYEQIALALANNNNQIYNNCDNIRYLKLKSGGSLKESV